MKGNGEPRNIPYRLSNIEVGNLSQTILVFYSLILRSWSAAVFFPRLCCARVRGSVVSSSRLSRGFTLLELIVALALFGTLSMLTYSSLRAMMDGQQQISRESERLAVVQMAVARLGLDIQQTVGRSIRDEYGHRQPALVFGASLGGDLELTRTGWENPGGGKRSNMQRITYRLDDGELIRESWRVLDRAPGNEPFRQALLSEVTDFQSRFLDGSGVWHDNWPPPAATPNYDLLPRAVEIWLELEDWGRIRRLFPLAAVAVGQ
jgi:general secretion pathway protein J